MLCLVCLPASRDFVWLFLAVPLVCLQFVIVVFPDHTHLLFLGVSDSKNSFQTIRNSYFECLSVLFNKSMCAYYILR